MNFNFEHHDNLSFVFVIPRVSLLLVYKDHWNESLVMRKVIAEILRNGSFSELYLGSQLEKYSEQFLREFEDSSIINIRISGIHFLDYQPKTVEVLFANEIKNPRNVMHFDNTRISLEKNVSCIDITIRISDSQSEAEQEIGAA